MRLSETVLTVLIGALLGMAISYGILVEAEAQDARASAISMAAKISSRTFLQNRRPLVFWSWS